MLADPTLHTTPPLTADFLDRFIMRPPTMNDIEAATELFSICSLDQIGADEFTVEAIRNEWATPDFNLDTDVRLVTTPDGQIVGYVEVWTLAKLPVHPWVWGRVHPDFEGQGIATTLMTWAEDRARQVLPRIPADIRVSMTSGTFSTHAPSQRFLADFGMTKIRQAWRMVTELDRELPNPEWPTNITLRTYNMAQDGLAVYRAVQDSFQDHWGFVPEPEETGYERWLHNTHYEEHDPNLWFLALDGDEVAAIALCRPHNHEDPAMGWVDTLGVRRPWRRQGLGLALLHAVFQEFARRGQARVGLGVDAGSLTGATRLYERAGMHPYRQWDTFEKELRPGRELSTQEVEA